MIFQVYRTHTTGKRHMDCFYGAFMILFLELEIMITILILKNVSIRVWYSELNTQNCHFCVN